MMLRRDTWSGASLALHPSKLAAALGVESVNQRPGRGDMRPWHEPLAVAACRSTTKTIYRMGRDTPSDAQFWLQWDTEVDVVRGLIADDPTEITYFTGDGVPKWTDNTFGVSAAPFPSLSRPLGVPAPISAPVVTIQAAGTGATETRSYVWIWANDKGWMSGPSAAPAVDATGATDATWRVTFNEAAPSGYNMAERRIYRSITSSSGTAFYYVGTVAASALFFDDSSAIDANEPLSSEGWEPPPADLKGLKALWNGIVVGFTGKSVRFSVEYRPYAWPLAYEIVVDDAIVGLAAFGETLIVLTTGQPYRITGSAPESMSSKKMELDQACVAKRSIVEFGHGISYASPDGLVYIGQGTAPRIATAGAMLRDDWLALNPSSIVAAQYEGAYIASYTVGGVTKGFMCSPSDAQGFYFLSEGWTAAYQDPITDALYIARGSQVRKWDAGTAYMTATDKTKTFILPRGANFGWGMVIADAYPVTIEVTATLIDEDTGEPEDITHTYQVADDLPFKLEAEFRSRRWTWRTTAVHPVQVIMLAESVDEMATIA
jgi:hypothetical protein